MKLQKPILLLIVFGTIAYPASALEKLVVGLIPKAQKPIALDGKRTGREGAFVTPVPQRQVLRPTADCPLDPRW